MSLQPAGAAVAAEGEAEVEAEAEAEAEAALGRRPARGPQGGLGKR